jgi:hypothetical protein
LQFLLDNDQSSNKKIPKEATNNKDPRPPTLLYKRTVKKKETKKALDVV